MKLMLSQRSSSFLSSSRSNSMSENDNNRNGRAQLHDDEDEEVCDDDSVHDSSPAKMTAADEQRAAKEVERKEIEEMAKKETHNLKIWRLILLLVMLGTGAMVSIATFIYIRQQQRKESLQSYYVFTQTVTTAAEAHFKDFWLALVSLGQMVTVAGLNAAEAEAAADGSTVTSAASLFPFVRIPMFELPASHTRQFSNVESVTWSPLVSEFERIAWMEYVQNEIDWHDESKRLQQFTTTTLRNRNGQVIATEFDTVSPVRSYIWRGNRSLDGVVELAPAGSGRLAPIWQASPPPYSLQYLNYDMFDDPLVRDIQAAVSTSRSGLLTAVDAKYATVPNTFASSNRAYQDAFHNLYTSNNDQGSVSHPHSVYIQPVFDGLDGDSSQMVGFLTAIVAFDALFYQLLPEGVKGMEAVLHNTCNQAYTYVLQGRKAKFKGVGDLHDTQYDHTRSNIELATFLDNATVALPGHCVFSVSLYYSNSFQAEQDDNLEVICTLIIALIFGMMAGAFYNYDKFVNRRNTKIVSAAATSGAFISTLFPTQVKKRLLEESEEEAKETAPAPAPSAKLPRAAPSARFSLDTINDDETSNDNSNEQEPLLAYKSKPIADLFTETTILFADIAGFSAWSSVREPSQVFLLLETLFRAFDQIAKKRKVFKVETVGDCYVAVAGLPDIRKDHAVVMARYAHECMLKMRTLSNMLEVTFGPDTGDLAMRMGMHSGPVTAGVLRGDRSRFQLFGDTMNTASRMESGGQRDKIHVSQETAELLIAAGKSAWVLRREDAIYTKGKGEVPTYWLSTTVMALSSDSSSHKETSTTDGSHRNGDDVNVVAVPTNIVVSTKKNDAKTARLVKWSEDVLLRLLKQIVAKRRACPAPVAERVKPNEARYSNLRGDALLVDEVKESIAFPRYKEVKKMEDPSSITLDPAVVQQLRNFVNAIAASYEANDFHNFEHASHVAMSVVKLLSRIVDPTSFSTDSKRRDSSNSNDKALLLHEKTFGIASDPLTQFACVFAALVHDAGHPGVPNAQLVTEQNERAHRYNNKCINEQHSIRLAMDLLFQKEYSTLRSVIYETDAELQRFRQIVVNTILATDFFDMELKVARNHRWERAFSDAALKLTSSDMSNRKATIALEHLLQASDIAHTMQHWHVYRKWNERYFTECYEAYIDGRGDRDPAEEWYEGELRFFDFNVLPLAHKLKECGVFGVSSDEYLNYASRNRSEWEKRGRDVVGEMVARIAQKTSLANSMSPPAAGVGAEAP